jgi:hypothetical protein
MGFTGREPPFFFLKPADAVVAVADGETGSMPYPSLTQNLHHEVELVVAIGQGGRDIAAADAAAHIYGYAIGLDMTRRDLQGDMKKQGRPWCIGKAFEQSAPIGPIHPLGRTGELARGPITLQVDGQLKQKGDLSDLIWNVAETIEGETEIRDTVAEVRPERHDRTVRTGSRQPALAADPHRGRIDVAVDRRAHLREPNRHRLDAVEADCRRIRAAPRAADAGRAGADAGVSRGGLVF